MTLGREGFFELPVGSRIFEGHDLPRSLGHDAARILIESHGAATVSSGRPRDL